MKKATFLTGTGSGNRVMITKKDAYVLLEFSDKEDFVKYLAANPLAIDKGTKVFRTSIQNKDESWTTIVTKTYQVIVRK